MRATCSRMGTWVFATGMSHARTCLQKMLHWQLLLGYWSECWIISLCALEYRCLPLNCCEMKVDIVHDEWFKFSGAASVLHVAHRYPVSRLLRSWVTVLKTLVTRSCGPSVESWEWCWDPMLNKDLSGVCCMFSCVDACKLPFLS
jgi:hypothetical protein